MQTLHSKYGDVCIDANAHLIHLATTSSTGATLRFQAIGDISPDIAPDNHLLVVIFLFGDHPLKIDNMSGHRDSYIYNITHFQFQRNAAKRDINRMLDASGIPSECAQVMEYFLTLVAGIAAVETWTHANITVEMPDSKTDHEVETMRYSEAIVTEEMCGICFDYFMEGAELGRMKCGHAYHDKCLRQWMERKCSCPYCRAVIQTVNVCL